MKSSACSMASLVEAQRDGRLGEREAGSLSRHLGTCTSCRELSRELDAVRVMLRRPSGPPVTPLEHQRGRLALLRAAALPPGNGGGGGRPARAQRTFLIGAGALALAALVAVPASILASLATPRSRPVPLAHHLPREALQAVPVALAQAGAQEGGSEVQRLYPIETTIRGSDEARFERHAEGGIERVSLREGTLSLRVRRLAAGERFLVETGDAEVEVRGTVFDVEAHAGRIAHVAVSEGKVEVRYRRAISVIAAGGAWEPPAEAAAASAVTLTASAVAAGAAGVDPGEGARRAPASRPLGRVASTAQPGARPADEGLASDPAVKGEGGDASKAFGEAVDLLGRGDYGAARKQLEDFRAAHPNDGRADLAAFLTIVSLQHAGRRAEAREAARRYLQLYPNGDRRAEAARVAEGSP
jgi:hypothetical protein